MSRRRLVVGVAAAVLVVTAGVLVWARLLRAVEVPIVEAPPVRFAIDQEAEVTIDTGGADGIVVPLAALTRDSEGVRGVLVVADGRTRFRPVETGSADGERVLIRQGLAAGERVVA